MTAVVTLDLAEWRPTLPGATKETAQRALEEGCVIRLPRLGFELTESERRFLSPAWSDPRAKNISLEGTQVKGAVGTATDRAELATMIARFAAGASDLVSKVLNSAVANAEQTPGVIPQNLVVERAWVDEGPTLRRYRPRAYGRAARVRKRTAHVTVIVKSTGEGI